MYTSPFADAGDEDLPDAPGMLAHDVPPPVPEVEVADHGDAPRVRGPHREARASDAFELHRVRPQLLVEPEVVPLSKQVEVLISENARKPVRVLDLGLSAILPRHPQTVRHALPNGPGEEPIGVDDLQGADGDRRRGRRPRRCSRPARMPAPPGRPPTGASRGKRKDHPWSPATMAATASSCLMVPPPRPPPEGRGRSLSGCRPSRGGCPARSGSRRGPSPA